MKSISSQDVLRLRLNDQTTSRLWNKVTEGKGHRDLKDKSTETKVASLSTIGILSSFGRTFDPIQDVKKVNEDGSTRSKLLMGLCSTMTIWDYTWALSLRSLEESTVSL